MTRDVGENLTIGFLILMLFSVQMVSADEPEHSIEFVELTVYRDGLVSVTQALTVNETFPSISIRLLTPSIENVIAFDENETVLDYELSGVDMTIFTLGSRRVLLEYDTISLTKKEAEVWTLILDVPYNVTVYLPEESTILYLNEMPTSLETEDERIIISLFPGEWEISYALAVTLPVAFRVSDLTVSPTEVDIGGEITISAKVTNIGEEEGSYTVVLEIDQEVENSKTVTLAAGASTTVEFRVLKEDAGTYSVEVAGLNSAFTVKEAPPPVPIPIAYTVGIAVLGAVIAGFILLKRRPPGPEKILRKHFDLRPEDRDVVRFISERGGKVLEAEIRGRFQELPRTTLWRLIKRLEKMEIVTVSKIGLQNQIELRK